MLLWPTLTHALNPITRKWSSPCLVLLTPTTGTNINLLSPKDKFTITSLVEDKTENPTSCSMNQRQVIVMQMSMDLDWVSGLKKTLNWQHHIQRADMKMWSQEKNFRYRLRELWKPTRSRRSRSIDATLENHLQMVNRVGLHTCLDYCLKGTSGVITYTSDYSKYLPESSEISEISQITSIFQKIDFKLRALTPACGPHLGTCSDLWD